MKSLKPSELEIRLLKDLEQDRTTIPQAARAMKRERIVAVSRLLTVHLSLIRSGKKTVHYFRQP